MWAHFTRLGPFQLSLRGPAVSARRQAGTTHQPYGACLTIWIAGPSRQTQPPRRTSFQAAYVWDLPVGVSPFLAAGGCNRTHVQLAALAPPSSRTPYNLKENPLCSPLNHPLPQAVHSSPPISLCNSGAERCATAHGGVFRRRGTLGACP
jgi:hypothetical protein